MPGEGVVTIGSKQWNTSIASTLMEITTGLSGVESVLQGTGMLFDLSFDRVRIDIDMSRMLFPLDIVFINSYAGVVGVMHNVKPAESEVRFEAAATPGARFFLEVNAGEAEGIEVGDNVDFTLPQEGGFDFTSIITAGAVIMGMILVSKAGAP